MKNVEIVFAWSATGNRLIEVNADRIDFSVNVLSKRKT